jgi:hypothetical protein
MGSGACGAPFDSARRTERSERYMWLDPRRDGPEHGAYAYADWDDGAVPAISKLRPLLKTAHAILASLFCERDCQVAAKSPASSSMMRAMCGDRASERLAIVPGLGHQAGHKVTVTRSGQRGFGALANCRGEPAARDLGGDACLAARARGAEQIDPCCARLIPIR